MRNNMSELREQVLKWREDIADPDCSFQRGKRPEVLGVDGRVKWEVFDLWNNTRSLEEFSALSPSERNKTTFCAIQLYGLTIEQLPEGVTDLIQNKDTHLNR